MTTEGKASWKDGEEVVKEIIFVKRLRVGDINVNVSLAGFRLIMDTSNLGIAVPAFQNAYMIGPANYFGKKYITHAIHQVLKSLASSGFEMILDKLAGKSSGKVTSKTLYPVEKKGDDVKSNNGKNKARQILLLGLPSGKINLRSPKTKKKIKSKFSSK
eukprot:CAMPEP_0197836238 /NCGR_PEP_ID=MMETSP1437-20131217/28332_1 /TAXON_ID=49252 ORGANISM="Eucampia antarctica, Strain CCMP1452" /NCGR_SAMPLE_ID=MMETSP1437 /ASSEMBLY_ACC=CAM_ASM_001096 /LENGTH=158 /DNA_ID=CAMNT_0043442263 /DNA_START=15 /DNA_END=494 /DNA_ORIENTATION=-